MSFLLEKKLEHEGKCELAVRDNRTGDAVYHAAKAAEFGFALVKQTEGDISTKYVEDAEGWLDIAEQLKAKPAKKNTGGQSSTSRRSRVTADSGGDLPADECWLVTEKPQTTFEQIAGMEEAKNAIREMIVFPLKEQEAVKQLKLRPGGGILLYGPPGTGKTTLARAAAHEIDASFFYASGAEIRSKWHGESEQRLRKLIQAAKAEPVSILFLDDVDGLLPRRGGNSVVDNRIVTQFLADIGGFEENDNVMMLLGATNKPWEIDEAVFRTKRFDAKLYIGPPDIEARRGIIRMHMDAVPVEDAYDGDSLADQLQGFSGSDVEGLVNAAKRIALRRKIEEGGEIRVLNEDFAAALQQIPCSITEKMLKQYERFHAQRF